MKNKNPYGVYHNKILKLMMVMMKCTYQLRYYKQYAKCSNCIELGSLSDVIGSSKSGK